jgi:hypothetical protein
MWKSKLQSIIVQNTTKAKTIGINILGKELVFIKILLIELRLFK